MTNKDINKNINKNILREGIRYMYENYENETYYNYSFNLPFGINKSNKTYLIQDNQGLIHDGLRELLNKDGWHELTKEQVLSSPNKFVDFFWFGQSNEEGTRFDKSLYDVKSTLKTLLWREKSHLTGKDVITNKGQLYFNMRKQFPEICEKHMAKSRYLTEVKEVKEGEILIVRPAGHGAVQGIGVNVVTNNEELEKVRHETEKRFKTSIVSNYITNPYLWEGRKFHIRAYILVNSGKPFGPEGFSWSFWRRGKLFTADLPYEKDKWTNKRIHDTHGKTTPRDIYFPEDIFNEEQTEEVIKQMRLILNAAANIVKPHTKPYEESTYGCEIFGIDFMVTDTLIVKLIEINAEAGYGYKDKEYSKYRQYCREYFDWFYSNTLLPIFYEKEMYFKSNDYIRIKDNDSIDTILEENNSRNKDYKIVIKEKDEELMRNEFKSHNILRNVELIRKLFMGRDSNKLNILCFDCEEGFLITVELLDTYYINIKKTSEKYKYSEKIFTYSSLEEVYKKLPNEILDLVLVTDEKADFKAKNIYEKADFKAKNIYEKVSENGFIMTKENLKDKNLMRKYMIDDYIVYCKYMKNK